MVRRQTNPSTKTTRPDLSCLESTLVSLEVPRTVHTSPDRSDPTGVDRRYTKGVRKLSGQVRTRVLSSLRFSRLHLCVFVQKCGGKRSSHQNMVTGFVQYNGLSLNRSIPCGLPIPTSLHSLLTSTVGVVSGGWNRSS